MNPETLEAVRGILTLRSDDYKIEITNLDFQVDWEIGSGPVYMGHGRFVWNHQWDSFCATWAFIEVPYRNQGLYSAHVLPTLLDFFGGRICSDTCCSKTAASAWRRAGAMRTFGFNGQRYVLTSPYYRPGSEVLRPTEFFDS